MADLSDYTDEELMAIAGEAPAPPTDDLSAYTSEELAAIAGPAPSSFEPTYEEPVSVPGSVWEGLKQGVTFGFGDELQSAIAAGTVGLHNVLGGDTGMTMGEAYGQALGEFRDDLSRSREQHPYLTGAGELTGAVLAPVGLAKAAPGLAGKATQFAARAPTRAGVGIGSLSGGLYGAGTGEGGLGQRAKSAGMGAGVGAVFGGGFGLANRALGAVSNRAARRAANRAEKTIAQESAATLGAPLKQVAEKLRKDFPDDEAFEAALDAYKKGDITLAEIGGKEIRGKAVGAAQYPSGAAKSEAFLEKKVGEASQRIKKKVSDYIADGSDFYGAIDDVVAKGRKKAAPLYDEAYTIDVTPTDTMKELMTRPSGVDAIKRASKIAADEGLDIQDMNSTQALDYIKRGFGDILETYRDKTTGKLVLDQRGRAIAANAQEFADDLKTLNPAYKKALDVSGDYLSTADAMNKGRKFMRVDSPVIKKIFSEYTPSQKEAYKIGVVKKIREQIDTASDTADLYKRVFGKEETRKKLASIMSPKEFKALSEDMLSEKKLYEFRNTVVGGSPSIRKSLAAAEIAEGGADLIGTLATGNVSSIPRNQLVVWLGKAFDGINDKSAGKIADILYETNPTKKLSIVRQIQRQQGLTKAEKDLVLRSYFKISDTVKNK